MPFCCVAQDFYIHYPNLSSTITLAISVTESVPELSGWMSPGNTEVEEP